MKTWLKSIGSAKEPITEWRKDYVGFRKANKPGIRTGDRLFLYAPGGSERVFALAEATGDPEPKKEGDCQWRLSVRYPINLPVASGILLGDVSSRRDLTRSLSQKSHIRLLPDESQSAAEKLQERERVSE